MTRRTYRKPALLRQSTLQVIAARISGPINGNGNGKGNGNGNGNGNGSTVPL